MLPCLALNLFGRIAHCQSDLCQLIYGNKLAIYLNALFERLDIRTGKHTCFIPCSLQDISRINARGAFAVGACDMDELQLILRAPQLLHKQLRTLQTQAHLLPARRVDVSYCIEFFHDDPSEMRQKRPD